MSVCRGCNPGWHEEHGTRSRMDKTYRTLRRLDKTSPGQEEGYLESLVEIVAIIQQVRQRKHPEEMKMFSLVSHAVAAQSGLQKQALMPRWNPDDNHEARHSHVVYRGEEGCHYETKCPCKGNAKISRRLLRKMADQESCWGKDR